jgi:hypothetical protein
MKRSISFFCSLLLFAFLFTNAALAAKPILSAKKKPKYRVETIRIKTLPPPSAEVAAKKSQKKQSGKQKNSTLR